MDNGAQSVEIGNEPIFCPVPRPFSNINILMLEMQQNGHLHGIQDTAMKLAKLEILIALILWSVSFFIGLILLIYKPELGLYASSEIRYITYSPIITATTYTIWVLCIWNLKPLISRHVAIESSPNGIAFTVSFYMFVLDIVIYGFLGLAFLQTYYSVISPWLGYLLIFGTLKHRMTYR